LVGHRHKIYQRIKEMSEDMNLKREQSVRIWWQSRIIGKSQKVDEQSKASLIAQFEVFRILN
jgi:hypothetical protein